MKIFTLLSFGLTVIIAAHPIDFHKDPFRQLEELWPTPTETRIASGAPGPKYWQQQADYDIQIELEEKKNILTGAARTTYHNNSPHTLSYLWIQLDRNRFMPKSLGHQSSETPSLAGTDLRGLDRILQMERFDGGFKIDSIVDDRGAVLKKRVVDTMMKVVLPSPLKPGQKFTYRITDSTTASACGDVPDSRNTKTGIRFLKSLNGFQGLRPTPICGDGRTRPFLDAANSLWNSGITESLSPFLTTTS